jgi:hypothetical protein
MRPFDPNAIFGMLFVLAILWMVFGSVRRRNRERGKDREDIEERLSLRNSELLDELARLEERIRVLERIVTDDPNDLKRQFRDLAG